MSVVSFGKFISEGTLETHGDAVTLESHGETEVSPVCSIAEGRACVPHEFSPVCSIPVTGTTFAGKNPSKFTAKARGKAG